MQMNTPDILTMILRKINWLHQILVMKVMLLLDFYGNVYKECAKCVRQSDHFSDGEETEYKTKHRILAAGLPLHHFLLRRITSRHITLRHLYLLYQCFRESDHFSDGEETEYETKQRILAASLPFVHTLGWTQNAIAKGKAHSTHRAVSYVSSP